MARSVQFTVDVTRKGGVISPLLFGHNLEHTRSCVWQGIGAQLVRNRKFCGKAQPSGVALDWYAIGADRAYFELEDALTYTAHYDSQDRRRSNEVHSQRIRCVADGRPCGIGQDGIPLVGGRRYEGRVALWADCAVPVRIAVLAGDRAQPCFQTVLSVEPGAWRECPFGFVAEAGCADASIEITCDRAANLYVGAVSLLPAPSFHGLRPDVVALLKEIGCAILRWPGGNYAGDYRWQDGLLPVDRRAPLASFMEMETLPHTRGFDCHEIGTDEFIALCREIGAEPFLTINPAWESPELSAAWVEYCNGAPDTRWGSLRAERGHPQPYGVKYWSLGNELGYGHMEGPNTPAEYTRRLRPYVDAMRLVDPAIALVSSGIWASPRPEQSDPWYSDCLPQLGQVVELISHHHYTPQLVDYLGPAAAEDFRRVVTTPAAVLQGIREIRAKLDAYAPPGRSVGISFDEWNVWYAWYRIPGVADGLHNAAMLNLLCREAARLGIAIGCFFQPVNEGAIRVEPDTAWLPAGGQVFPLFQAHRGRTLLDLAPQDGLADVDLTASLDERTGQMAITLVNRSPQEQHQVPIRVQGGGITAVEGKLLAAADYAPGSRFSETRPDIRRPGADELIIILPQLSVARIDLHLA